MNEREAADAIRSYVAFRELRSLINAGASVSIRKHALGIGYVAKYTLGAMHQVETRGETPEAAVMALVERIGSQPETPLSGSGSRADG